MAETQILNLTVNVNDAVKNTKALAEEVEQLKAQTKQAKEETGELSEEYIQYNASLKSAQKELNASNRALGQLIASEKEEAGTLDKLNAKNTQLRIERGKLNLETEEGIKRNIEINAELNKNNAFIKENSDQLKQQKLNVGNYTDSINEALGGLDGFSGGLVGVVQGLKASTAAALKFIATPIGAVLAAIAVVIGTLKAAFDRSLSSQEKLNEITGKLAIAFNLALDAIIPFVEFILDNALAALDKVGKAVSFVIDKLADWGIISEETNEKVKKSFEETSAAVENLASAERQLAQADIALQKLQLKFQTQAERLRQIRDDESVSIQERIKANEELGKVLNRQIAAERKQALLVLNIAKQRQLVNGESIQSIREIGEAEIKLLEITERVESQKSEQLVNTNSLNKDLLDQNTANELLSAQRSIEINDNRNEAIRQSNLSAADEALNTANVLNEKLKEQSTLVQEQRALDLEQQQAQAQQNIFSQLALERQALATKEADEVQAAKNRGLKTTAIEAKYTDARKALNKAENDAKLALAGDFLGNIAQIAGEGTAIGKAAAVAQTTVSTFQAAQGAYASLASIPIVGPALGIAAAAAAVASGIANVKGILNTKSGLPEGGGTSASGSAVNAVSVPSATNIGIDPLQAEIGQGIVSRNTIENQQQTPQAQSILVVDSVTAKQNLQNDNQITSIA